MLTGRQVVLSLIDPSETLLRGPSATEHGLIYGHLCNVTLFFLSSAPFFDAKERPLFSRPAYSDAPRDVPCSCALTPMLINLHVSLMSTLKRFQGAAFHSNDFNFPRFCRIAEFPIRPESVLWTLYEETYFDLSLSQDLSLRKTR